MLIYAALAYAAGYSLDVELARTGFSGAVPGLDAPEVQKRGHVRAGVMVQYEMNPLVLEVDEVEIGPVVANRFNVQLGASVDVSKKLALRATLPLSANWGSTVTELQADGFGTGDLSAGLRYEIVNDKLIGFGAHADLLVPLNAAGMYMSETSPRFLPGISFAAKPGDLRVAADLGFMLRGPVVTQQTLSAGQELTAGVDVSYGLLKDKVRPHLFMLTRVGMEAAYAGRASAPLEVLAGVQTKITKEWGVDAYGGRGLTEGYGSTDLRAIVMVTFNKNPKEQRVVDDTPIPVFEATVSDADLDKIIEEPEPEPEAPKELAVVTQKEIVIRDPIQFALGTDKILPESQPTLDFVAKLMSENPDIQGLVIEGHASAEGTFESNYEISRMRCEAVFRELIDSGVSPTRLSYRAYGETIPVKAGDDAANRRVVFGISHRLAPGEANPGWDTKIVLPWNGEPRTIPGPALPADTAPRERPKTEHLDIDESKFDDDGEK